MKQNYLLRNPFTLFIHIALVIILAGAIVTHFCGIQGKITLTTDEQPKVEFEKDSGPGEAVLPFPLKLKDVEIIYYPGTSTPMDFKSVLDVNGSEIDVSMNKIGTYRDWRFYQSAMGDGSATLALSHDPFGIMITYIGYALLGISMLGFFFQRSTPWRGLFKALRKYSLILFLLTPTFISEASTPTIQRPLAANLGKVCVYWNDRIAPMQTMALDVTRSLYGADSYQGMTAEQVLAGWLFYFDEWWGDYTRYNPRILDIKPDNISDKQKKEAAKLSLIQWLGTGDAFKIYPYNAGDGKIEWLSLTGRRPAAMSLEQWKFMQTTMPEIKTLIMRGKNIEANEVLDSLVVKQVYYAGQDNIPSSRLMQLERVYNKAGRPAYAGIFAFGLSILLFFVSFSSDTNRRGLRFTGNIMVWILLIFIVGIISCIWILSRHIPLSNGPETMLFMALVSAIGACVVRRSDIKGALTLICGLCLMVAAMGSKTPKIGALMPVLGSPLLSIHVMLVMIAYVLFLLMAVLSAVALLSRSHTKKEYLSVVNRLILTPAVCLLAAGIFIGAVWANQSWGRYWGWDPKETCALIMLLIYALPVHWGSRRMACFRNPRVLHIYLLLAVLTVAFTYFGANYLLPGLHSYA